MILTMAMLIMILNMTIEDNDDNRKALGRSQSMMMKRMNITMALGRSQSSSDILNTAVNDNRGTAHMLW